MNKLLVCLTGGIASGKTRVSDQLHQVGAAVIDTDVLARQVVQPGTVGLQRLIDRFGTEVLTADGGLDRAQLKRIIFQHEQHRQAVNRLLHPLIWQAAQQQANSNRQTLEIWVIPLYRPASTPMAFDRVLVTDVAESVQLDRVMQRDEVDRSMAQSIINSQMSRRQRLQLATDVVVNNGTLQQLDEKVAQIHALYGQLIAAKEVAAMPQRN